MGSPVRQSIIAVLRALGSASISEIAGELDRKPDRLYHHVRLLVKCGLLVRSGERVSGKNREALYSTRPEIYAVDPQQQSGAYVRAQSKVFSVMLFDAAKQYRRAIENGRGDVSLAETLNVRLTEPQADWLRSEIHRIVDHVRGLEISEGQRYVTFMLVAPISGSGKKNPSV